MSILQQYRDDKAWLIHQLEQRHNNIIISSKVTPEFLFIYKNICDSIAHKKYITTHDKIMERRFLYLLAVEKELGLKSPYG